jgi:Na+/proline symporter
MQEAVQQTTSNLAGIDIAIVILYMVGVFALGTFFGKYVKNAGDFFVASRALPFWAIGMSIVVSDIGAMDFVAVAGGAYTDGIAVANFDWIGSMPAMVFAAFIFVPYFWRAGVYTIPEFLGRRYNTAVRVLHAGIWGIFLLTMLSLMLWVTGDQLSHTILGWNPYFVIFLMVIITGIYTFSGGLSAVVMVDVVQLIIMFVGGIALLALCMWEVGGPFALAEKVKSTQPRTIVTLTLPDHVEGEGIPEVPEDDVRNTLTEAGFEVVRISRVELPGQETPNKFLVRLASIELPETQAENISRTRDKTRTYLAESLASLCGEAENVEVNELSTYESQLKMLLPHDTDKPYPWTGIVFGLGIVLAIAYMSGNQAVVQRTLGARSEWDAKGGMLFGGFLKSFIPLMVAVPGLCAIVLAPDLGDGERAVPHMIATILPPGLRGLMFVALFAALMSSVDSTLNSSTTIWTNDLYGRLVSLTTGKPITERHALIVGRAFTMLFIVTAGLLAPVMKDLEGLYVFVQTALSMFQGPTLAILLLGIIWKRANRWGGLAGLVLGVCFTTVMNMLDGVFPANDPFLFVAWWSFVFSSAVCIIVSLITPPEPEEKIRGLVWGQVMKDGEIQRVLGERVS